ncbi:MAG: hypothetical protein GY928_16330 [Colwellia sp.]|nr:hypothetical protein [Colwellia sp.]
MKIQDLLKMDMGEAVEWLIDNQYDFELVDREEVNTLLSDCHAPASDVRDWKLVDRINDAITKLE